MGTAPKSNLVQAAPHTSFQNGASPGAHLALSAFIVFAVCKRHYRAFQKMLFLSSTWKKCCAWGLCRKRTCCRPKLPHI